MISKSWFEICPSDEGASGRQPLRAAARRLSAARRVFKHWRHVAFDKKSVQFKHCQWERVLQEECLNTFRCKSVAARPNNLSATYQRAALDLFQRDDNCWDGWNYGDWRWRKAPRTNFEIFCFDIFFPPIFRNGDMGWGEHWDVF